MKNISWNKSAGFTLIELLVVIGILGILAAVLLVAVNPLEQLARGRDAARISEVAQLGKGMASYYTAQQLTAYPAVSTTWETTYLVGNNEIPAVATVTVTANPCPAADAQGNICYVPGTNVNANDTALVWTPLESQSNLKLYNTRSGGACTSAKLAVVWDSSQARAGMACLSAAGAAPTVGIALY